MEAKQYVTKQPMDHWRNQRGNKKYLETNENKNTVTQNWWDTAKAVLRRKFMAIQSYLRKQEQPNLTSKATRKWKTKTKVSRKKEVIQIRAEINEIETKKTIEKVNESKSCFFQKINKIDKPLARLGEGNGNPLQYLCLENPMDGGAL